jgi:hypothetical protein
MHWREKGRRDCLTEESEASRAEAVRMVKTCGGGGTVLEKMLLSAWHTVGAQKRWLPPSMFAPLPLSPRRQFPGSRLAELSIGVSPQPLPVRRRAAAALTCAGASQLFPLLRAPEIRAPGLNSTLHRRHAALGKGTDIILRSLSHVRRAAPCRCPLPAGAGTG